MYRNQNTIHSLSSSPKIYEVYLFVNPIGLKCYQAEQEVLKFIEDMDHIKIHFRFITFHNFNTVSQYMKRLNLPSNNLQLRNQIYHTIYDACLAYKAALMQGKKRGRNFLLLLQKELTSHPIEYSDELLVKVAKGARLDVDMFFEDKASDFVKNSYESDQQIAQEMNIMRTPSLVIFDNLNQHYGVLLEDVFSYDLIEEAFGHSNVKNKKNNEILQKDNVRAIGKDYLTIIK
ncbi:DsbA family protein [Jeotgalibaca ciconiae]|uniref:Oxidoreductase n=1 Tax=Jeotgalibaca ciconiae TaxID=2496265 RepID=A0A3S9HCF1_9LACT|nr:DsbA family protein [Jeotgalibaca ciconiae]AZP05050.1 oxidoreductase [Jeotgalibaca ciconiae]